MATRLKAAAEKGSINHDADVLSCMVPLCLSKLSRLSSRLKAGIKKPPRRRLKTVQRGKQLALIQRFFAAFFHGGDQLRDHLAGDGHGLVRRHTGAQAFVVKRAQEDFVVDGHGLG